MGVSVIICCYNSSAKLAPTLKALSEQISIGKIPCEIVLVNNNSTDESTEVALETWKTLQSPFPLKIVDEKTLGLSHARKKGIECSRYEYLVFCDDDNWLCSDYLYRIHNLFEAMPGVALIGGVGEAVFESPPPKWFYELDGFGYAVGAEGRQTGYVESVYGAGMALRKSVFNMFMDSDFVFLLSDRKGNSLSSGGDMEISRLVTMAGYKIYLDTELHFKHFLSAGRLTWKYYLQLRSSFGKAHAYLNLYHEKGGAKTLPGNIKTFRNTFIQLIKLLVRNIPESVFPHLYKNAKSAQLVQRSSEYLSYLREHKKIKQVAKKVHETDVKKNASLKTIDQH